MAVALISADAPTFVVRSSGKVTYQEVQRVFDELLDHPELVPGTSVLTDARDVTGVPSTSELRLIARQMRRLTDRGVHGVAIVTDSNFVYGVARMFSVFAELTGVPVSVFRDMGEAHCWLATQTKKRAAG